MCTLEKRGRIYLLTLTGAGEHRLNPTVLTSIRSALNQIRSELSAGGGGALVTAGEGKFFSNGLDLAWAKPSPSDRLPLLSSALRSSIADLISLPIPTIAAVTGHAAAAGFGLAIAHDYVVMRADRGFLYMSEIDIGVPMPRYFMELVRAKVADPKARRDVVLRGVRLPAGKAAEMGIVDRAVEGVEGTVEAAVGLAEELAGRGWDGRVYASIRMGTMPELCRELGVREESDEGRRNLFLSRM